jgi:hypothetical protein
MDTIELERKAAAIQVGLQSLKELCGDDQDLYRDMVEGEIDLEAFASYCVDQIVYDAAVSASIKNMIEDLQGRKKRFEDRQERIRTLLAMTLDAAGSRKIELPQATVSLSQRAAGLVVKDEAEIPATWWVRGDPKLNKKGLLEALRANEKIPGVELDNGAASLTIRRS